MKALNRYINNTSAFQFIQLLRFATLFLIGVVFTRHYKKADIGEYEALLFAASAVSYFWLRGILQSFLSLVKAPNGSSKNSDYFNTFLLLILFSGITVLFLVLFRNSISNLLTHNVSYPYFNLLLAFIFLNTPSFLIEHIFLTRNQPKAIIIYAVISYGLQFAALIIPPLIGFPIKYSINALIAVNAIRFLFLIGILIKYSGFKISTPFIKEFLYLAFPLIGSALLSGSGQYIDGIIVTHFFDASTFAVFRYGARELPLVIIMASALSNSMIPYFNGNTLNEALVKLKKDATGLMHLLFPVTIITLLVSNWIFQFLFTPEFSYSAKIFNLYLLIVIPRLLFPQTIFIGLKKTGVLLWVSLTEITLNITLSLIFVRFLGLWGIAFATLIANLFERWCLIILVKSKIGISLSKYLSLKWYVLYSLATLVVYLAVDFVVYK